MALKTNYRLQQSKGQRQQEFVGEVVAGAAKGGAVGSVFGFVGAPIGATVGAVWAGLDTANRQKQENVAGKRLDKKPGIWNREMLIAGAATTLFMGANIISLGALTPLAIGGVALAGGLFGKGRMENEIAEARQQAASNAMGVNPRQMASQVSYKNTAPQALIDQGKANLPQNGFAANERARQQQQTTTQLG